MVILKREGNDMEKIKGVPVSEGRALGKILLLSIEDIKYEKIAIQLEALEGEKEKLHKALQETKDELTKLIDMAKKDEQSDQVEIFETYVVMLSDVMLIQEVEQLMEKELANLEHALSVVGESYVAKMLELDDPYFRARADDFKQIFRMIFDSLKATKSSVVRPTEPFILAAKEIGPADMAKVDRTLLQGFILEHGSRTSHAAIISRAMGIPMISGIESIESVLSEQVFCALDGTAGHVYISPTDEIIEEYQSYLQEIKQQNEEDKKLLNEEAITVDGTHIELMANIGSQHEVQEVLDSNADGIGLFRTEFFYMENGGTSLPTEEEQFEVYKQVLSAMGEKPVIFRTLDAGGDKQIASLGIPAEENPFLGWRAIRYCLKRTDVFKTQIRALLRASMYGNAKIMLPMIISKEEVLQAKTIIHEVYEELQKESIDVKKVPVGIMIETPAAAVNAVELASISDFFSIGTNDLTQYTLAVDRGNGHIADLYDEGHPAVMYLIRHVIDSANKANIPVGLCGEMAGNADFTEKLLKNGLRDFSMSPILILKAKKLIRSLSTKA